MNSIAVGAKIRAMRGAESQQALADKLKISKSALAMYERGERIPRDEVKIRIAQHFGVSIESIFSHKSSTNCAETGGATHESEIRAGKPRFPRPCPSADGRGTIHHHLDHSGWGGSPAPRYPTADLNVPAGF